MRDLATGLALVLVIEGILYALFPDGMKRVAARAMVVPPQVLRAAGLLAASFGVDSLLPERTKIYFRARVIDAAGVVRQQKIDSFTVRSWLRLVDPVAAKLF